MGSEPAIRVDRLGKRYRLAAGDGPRGYRTLRESLASAAGRALRRTPPGTAGEFWAVRDVSFDVQPGEAVGVIGRNGAGKSTLLKLLSRITKPTEGRVELGGRVGSLLEVGTGFHPELSGRENVYLNGSILGMTRREIAARFDAIVGFAEVERFLDTPVKRYSSGMAVRLAFAVAAHLEPEILIIDEVLAVGDAAFQKKCLGKMGEVARSGRTVLFVSHDLHAVARLTSRAVLLSQGRVARVGPSGAVIREYLAADGETAGEWRRAGEPGAASLTAVRLRTAAGEPSAVFDADRPVVVEIEAAFAGPTDAQLAFRLNADADVDTVFTTALSDAAGDRATRFPAGRHTARVTIPGHFLPPGRYHLLVALNNPSGRQFDLVERAVAFEVTEVGALARLDGRLGRVAPLLRWEAPNW